MGVNEKMREALEIIAAIADKYAGEYPTQIGSIAREALAQQPDAGVELTDDEVDALYVQCHVGLTIDRHKFAKLIIAASKQEVKS